MSISRWPDGFWLVTLLALAGCSGSVMNGGDDHAADDAVDQVDGGAGDDDGGSDDDGGGEDAPPDAGPPTRVVTVCPDSNATYATIGAAIAAVPDGSLIEICAGSFAERLTIDGRSLTLRGAGVDATIIDAGGIGVGLLVTGGAEVTVEGVTVRRGFTESAGGAVACVDSRLTLRASALLDSRAQVGGGGLYGLRCNVEIAASRVAGSEGTGFGGGVYLIDATGTITGSQLAGNSADEGGGLYLREGAVHVRSSTLSGNHARIRGGALYQNSDSAIEDSVLSDNTSGWTAGGVYVWQHAPTFRRDTISGNDADWEGGGFYLHQSQVVIEDSQITANTSFDDGGGLRLFESRAVVSRNLIADNHAVDGDGGGFKSSHLPSVFTDNTIRDNRALGAGGGCELDNDSSVVRGGLIAGNRASIGGGIHVMLWPWNDGLIEGLRLEGNRAWRGGAMYLENSFVPVTVRDLIITGNTAHQGAGVYTRGTPLKMSNVAVTGNAASSTGGAFYVDPSASYPWTLECPCPPIDPAAEISFVVAHGNTASSGAGAWIGAPNLTLHSSIFSGHASTGVEVGNAAIPTWRYNNTFPATFVGMSPDDVGNQSTDPGFATAEFHLGSGSACIDAGDPAIADPDGSRADMGIHAGPHAMP